MNYQILVNKDNRIPKDFHNCTEWVEVLDSEGQVCKIERVTYRHFEKLVSDFSKKNIFIEVSSGYRSIQEQEELFLNGVQDLGIEKATKLIAKPYYSEHHTGLAIDINIWKKGEKEFLNNEDTKEEILNKKKEEYQQIHEALKDYGFILRYPRGKEEITGYSYEPWHIRYVGSLAKQIPDGETFEEYTFKQIQK